MSARSAKQRRRRESLDRSTTPPTARHPPRPAADVNRESRHALLVAAGTFALALAVRLLYLGQIRSIGFFSHPVSDAFVFVERARGIAAGDWLGPADFVHAPLYAYVLGIIRLFGDEVWTPRVVQSFFGSAACAVLALTCRSVFGLRSAMVAGLLLALYPPAIFFDGLIQKTSLALLLSTLLLWLLMADSERAGWWRAALAGVFLGLLALTRQNALALVPLALVWLGCHPAGTTPRTRLARPLACAVGLAATLFPWALRNKLVIGDFVLTTPNLGQNFAMGNNPDAGGTYLEFERGTGRAETEQRAWTKTVQRALGRTPTAGEVSDYYLEHSLAWIKDHPGTWLALLGKKWCMTWNAYEAFDTEDYYLYRERSPILATFDRALNFGVLAPLAAAGIVLTLRDRRRLWLLYGWLLITAAAVAVFVVFARYRFPLIPVLAMFAAAAIVEGAARVRRRQFSSLIAPAAALIAAAVAANWTIDHPRAPDAVSYTNHAVVLRETRRYDEAQAELQKALAISPDHVGANLAMCNTLSENGRHAEALPFGERARAAAPDYAAAYRGLGDARLGLRQFEQATALYRRALEIDADDYRALNMLASTTAQLGRLDEALKLFDRMTELAPDYAEGQLNLGNTYLLARRLDDAAAAYERALALKPDFIDALHNLGVVELDRRNFDRAINLFRRVLNADSSHEMARRNLAEAEAARRR